MIDLFVSVFLIALGVGLALVALYVAALVGLFLLLATMEWASLRWGS